MDGVAGLGQPGPRRHQRAAPSDAGVYSRLDIPLAERVGQAGGKFGREPRAHDAVGRDRVAGAIEQRDALAAVEPRAVENAVGGRARVNISAQRPCPGVVVAEHVGQLEAMRRQAGVVERVKPQRARGDDLAATADQHVGRQHIGDGRHADQRLAERGLERPRQIEHLVSTVGVIVALLGTGAFRSEEDGVVGQPVDAVQNRAGAQRPRSERRHDAVTPPSRARA